MYRTASFTCSEFFEKVWATPLLKLARENHPKPDWWAKDDSEAEQSFR